MNQYGNMFLYLYAFTRPTRTKTYTRGENLSSAGEGHWKNQTRNYYWLLKIRRLYLLQHWNRYKTDLPSCYGGCSLFATVVRHGGAAGGS